MMSGLFRPQGASPAEQEAMRRAQAEEQARLDTMTAAWRAYRGDWPAPLPPSADGVDDSIRLNKCKTIVETANGLLFAPPPSYDLPAAQAAAPPPDAAPPPPATPFDPAAPPPDPTTLVPAPEVETPEELWLKACLAATGWPVFLLDVRTNGGVTGTAYAKLVPPDATRGHSFPTVQALDSAAMQIRVNPRDITDVTAYIWQSPTSDAAGRPIMARQVTQRVSATAWEIVDQHKSLGLDMDPAQPWINDKLPTPWPYPWAPIVHCKNLPAPNSVYGTPDLTDGVIALNRALNFQYSNDSRVQHRQGNPILYATGMNGKDSTIRATGINYLPNPDAKIGVVAPALDVEAARILRKELHDVLDDEGSTPAVTRGRGELTNPSGVAIRLQFWPMDLKLRQLQTCYEPLLTAIISHLLELGKQPGVTPTWTWPSAVPVNMLEERQGLQIEQAMGTVSRATIAGVLGRDWPAEQANLVDEAAIARALNPPPPVDPATGAPLAPKLASPSSNAKKEDMST